MLLYFTQMDPPPASVCAELATRGWQVTHLPFRRVVFRARALDFSGFDLLIITSKQAARWLCARQPQWTPPIAVVGRSTAGLLAGFPLLFGDEERAPPANAGELVTRLGDHAVNKVLFLSGARVGDAVESGLAHLELTREIVYHTERICENFAPLAAPAMVYFQAPGTVADYRETYQGPPAYIGAIGSSTAAALSEVGWRVDFQPGRPENQVFAAQLPGPNTFTSRE